jgi:hypothetical protein
MITVRKIALALSLERITSKPLQVAMQIFLKAEITSTATSIQCKSHRKNQQEATM